MTPEDYPVIDAADARRKAVIGLESGYVGIGALCKYMLRILDAFDAMERERWMLWNWNAEHAEPGEPLSWSIEPEGGDGPCVREAKSPLEALLAAAATLEDKSDEG